MPLPKPKSTPAASQKSKLQPAKPSAPQAPAAKTAPSAGIPNFSGTPANMNGHAAPGVPNRATAPRGQMTNVGTSYRYSDPSGLTPANPKPNVSNNLAQVTSTPSAPKISAKDANTRDVRLERENNARNAINKNSSYQSSVEQKTKSQKATEYKAQPTQPKNGATTFKGKPVIGGASRIPSLGKGGGILGAIPMLVDAGRVMSGKEPKYTSLPGNTQRYPGDNIG